MRICLALVMVALATASCLLPPALHAAVLPGLRPGGLAVASIRHRLKGRVSRDDGGAGSVNDDDGGKYGEAGSSSGSSRKTTGEGESLTLEGELQNVLGDDDAALWKDLNAAAERVARARKELEALEEMERRARADDTMDFIDAASSLVAECEREVLSAEADVKQAERVLVQARAGSSAWGKWDTEIGSIIQEDRERMESGKAAAVSALAGTMASIPWFLVHPTLQQNAALELSLSAGLVFVSSALFGLTYRYAIRRDLGNTQLKFGCVAAFALVRGLGQIDALGLLLLFDTPGSAAQKLLQACFLAGESFVVFAFAGVALEFCFRQGLISPFPVRGE